MGNTQDYLDLIQRNFYKWKKVRKCMALQNTGGYVDLIVDFKD